jgi:hypothetical protein
MLSDLDYDSYFPETSPTVAGHAKRLLDQALWNYTSVLLAQPFEVAKTILQIHEASGQLPSLGKLKTEDWGSKSRPDSFHSGKYEDVGMSRLDMWLRLMQTVSLRRRKRRGLARLLHLHRTTTPFATHLLALPLTKQALTQPPE